MKQTFDYLENVPSIVMVMLLARIYMTPWYDEEGSIAGLIELAIDLPDQMPVFNRDKE